MKVYTDILQSKKLAEILSIDTADGSWKRIAIAGCNLDVPEEQQYIHDGDMPFMYYSGIGIPSWSLAALLEQIPSDLGSSTLTIEKCDSEPFKYGLNYHDRWGREDDIQTKYYDDLVDACYEMILKLNKQKFL